MAKKPDQPDYHDFKNVEDMHNYIIPEGTPEGPYGSPIGKHTPVEGKSTEWEHGQRTYSAFNYVNKDLHQHTPRKYPGHHPPHDSSSK
ncbi:hypothetical protein [Alkalicoccobacillus murimartini]|uniref:Cytosolic protein n=1 Tax=Alkalicoccobacillus murimartini TaxID=171685 RepID=A0ABT9YHD9_9BACI|nr:hypothetical protein [Alkalicoccobacillus murimartini]MDQ0206607.1 hypothetical protein [Alkalicoccobacillus murimartini]